MQKTTFQDTLGNGEFLLDMGLILRCAIEKLGRETISLDPYAYIWNYADIFVLSIILTEDANIVKQNNQYYITSETDSTCKFVLEIKDNVRKHCREYTSFIRLIVINFLCLVFLKVLIWTSTETLAAAEKVQLKF